MSAQTHTTRRHFVKTIGAVGAAAAAGPFFHARPAKADKGQRFPGVVIIHGGGFTGGNKRGAREQNIGTTLAKNGYVCISIDYLLAAKDLAPSESRIFEIGGTDVVSYGELIREYARQQGMRRWLISVPVLTPYLSGLWLALVTPASFEIGRHLIEGLKNPTVIRDRKALEVFAIRPMGIREAIQRAVKDG